MPSYVVVRKASINATPDRVHELINDFHHWASWSPWEDLDPAMQKKITGPGQGVGAHYAWSGNKKAGAGSMEIVSSTPEQIRIDLQFLKPMKSRSDTVFGIAGSGHGTEVSWTMSGEQRGVWGLVSRFYSMDKVIGKDFEKGLSRLKSVAESD